MVGLALVHREGIVMTVPKRRYSVSVPGKRPQKKWPQKKRKCSKEGTPTVRAEKRIERREGGEGVT